MLKNSKNRAADLNPRIQWKIRFSRNKMRFSTTKSFLLRNVSTFCKMFKHFAPDRFFLQKNHFSYNKIRFGIPEMFLSQNVERFHTKSIFPTERPFFLQQNPFWNSKMFFVAEC